jgi:cell division septation protein DedD
MASNQDDSFREIQLSGKQLVFLFMAVVVILVGVFLMGLQVGRGVLMARGAPGADTTVSANESEPPPPPASASPGSSTSPATAAEKLSYAERLGAAEPPKESLKASPPPESPPTPRSESPAPPTSPAPAPVSPTPPPATKTAVAPAAKNPPATSAAPAAAKSAEPAGSGFAIQVAALRESGEADAMVKRLAGKGYPAYVVAPAKGQPSVYRVRVGKFKDRHEADTVAARLQKEEQFKPWVVR